ncbi:hypothetical protein [Kitasatospora sp. NPDC127116]|uniref:hypothetical protein n=1 Tax=Kitasatospora sp. NPDC127116 TaxID=3345367 RepID=UPI00362EC259
MPLRLRAERRAFSRDAARTYTRPNPADGPTRRERRRHGWRGDISALVHGKHDTSWLRAQNPAAGGRQRANAKRNARAAYWHTVRIQVSPEIEPHFRQSLHLLHPKAQLRGRHLPLHQFVVDLDVHIPGAPADAVRAVPTYRALHHEGRITPRLDSIDWYRADGSLIGAATSEPQV